MERLKTQLCAPAIEESKSAGEAVRVNLLVRGVEESDFEKGFPSILGQLSDLGEVTRDEFIARLREMKESAGTYFVAVIEDLDKKKIIGAATLVIEKKFLRKCGKCGHIEDVVVDETYRGLSLGSKIMSHLKEVAKAQGCYKLILDCAEKNVKFYEKLGFVRKELQMACYF